MATGLLTSYTKTLTWSLVDPHGPLFTLHWNTFWPTPSPVIVVKGEVGAVIVPWPLMRIHDPVPGATAGLAAIDTAFVVEQML